MRTFTVLVHWEDGDVADADEFAVAAISVKQAKMTASTLWSATNGAKYPNARIVEIEILTRRMMRSLA